MADEVVAALSTVPGGVVVDCTLGGGGHTEAILRSRTDLRVIGLDRDLDALKAATARLQPFADRFVAVHRRFGAIDDVLAEQGVAAVAGIVADLGVSSPQLERGERGFSIRNDGPLDMRMDASSGEPLIDRLRRVRSDELADILWSYGDVQRSRRVARAIEEAIAEGVETTAALAAHVARALPGPSRTHPATRVFQALRIWVNDEIGEVEALLAQAPAHLLPGGVLAVISFHSGEDRVVKHAMRQIAPRDSDFELVTRKSIEPEDVEVEGNPRARSARLRLLRRRIPGEPRRRKERAAAPEKRPRRQERLGAARASEGGDDDDAA